MRRIDDRYRAEGREGDSSAPKKNEPVATEFNALSGAIETLDWVTSLMESLQAKVLVVTTHAGVISAHRMLDFKRYGSGSVVEACVDAELHNGMAITWWFELNWSSAPLHGRGEITITDSEGQYNILTLRESEGDWLSLLRKMSDHRAAILAIDVDEVLRRRAASLTLLDRTEDLRMPS